MTVVVVCFRKQVPNSMGGTRINSWPNTKQTLPPMCATPAAISKVPRETFKIDLAEKRSWRSRRRRSLSICRSNSCLEVAFLCCYRAWVTILIKSLRDAKAIRFPLVETLISFLFFLSVYIIPSAGMPEGTRVTPFHQKTFICMHLIKQSWRKYNLDGIKS